MGWNKCKPSQFAMTAIREWGIQFGKKHYLKTKHLLMEADAGGCNGYRPRLWKTTKKRFMLKSTAL